MAQLIRTYQERGLDVPIRVDHVPVMAGKSGGMAGYTALGRLCALGYLEGPLEMDEVDRLIPDLLMF